MLILSSPSFQAQVFGFPTDHYPEITFGITSGIILGTVNSDSVLMDNLMILTGKEVMKQEVKIQRQKVKDKNIKTIDRFKLCEIFKI